MREVAEADFYEVTDNLNKLGLKAEVVPTGGGIDCIVVDLGNPRLFSMNDTELYFGTGGEFWGASVYIDDEYTEMEVWSDLRSDDGDAAHVAGAIYRAVKSFLIGGI